MITRKFLLSALTMLAIIFTPGCKDEETEFVSMNVTTKSISVGEEYQFFVSVQSTGNSVYGGTVKWSIDDENIASIDQTGKVIGKSEGESTVKATLDNGRYAIAKLYVGDRTVSAADSIYISRNLVYMNQSSVDTLNVWIAPEYADATCFPVSAALADINTSSDVTAAQYELLSYKDYMIAYKPEVAEPGDLPEGFTRGAVYVLVLKSGGENEDLTASVTVGDLTQQIEVHVDFALYLSFNTIEPGNPSSNPGLAKSLSINTGETSLLQFNFYVEDSNSPEESFDKVKTALLDKSNYTLTGSAGIVLGTPSVDIDTYQPGTAYSLTMNITAGDVAGSGVLKVNVFGKELSVDLTIDDGESYERVYISFTKPNTYTIPPTEMTLTTTITTDMSIDESAPNTFKIRVYHDISPDTRAPYIDWQVSQSGDPVIIPLGRQCSSDNLYTEFEYQVGTAAGSASVVFSVYNPQGELGTVVVNGETVDYGQYLNQSITATITVQDKSAISVNSVTFNPDDIVTNAAAVPLEAVMDPATSATAWPIQYSIVEGTDLASISEGTSESGEKTYQLNILKAGVIKVKAAAGEGEAEKSDILTVTAKLRLDQNATKPLEITNAPSTMYVGDNGTVTKLLHANYTVDESQYTWRSSRPDVIKVDAQGNILAKAEGKADIIVEIKDDYNSYASDQRTIEVKTLDISADLNTLPSDYYVVYDGNSEFWVDTESGSSDYYTFSLDTDILSSAGTYTAGVDFNGSVTFPNNKGATLCEITGGTIEVNRSNNTVTFNLTVAYGSETGTITGTRELLTL